MRQINNQSVFHGKASFCLKIRKKYKFIENTNKEKEKETMSKQSFDGETTNSVCEQEV